MAKEAMKKRSVKKGLPAGTLVHIGQRKAEQVKISVMVYDEAGCEEQDYENLEACIPIREKPAVTWINVEGLHRTDIVEKLGSCFGLHPLLLEDVLNTDQRPKAEHYDKYLFIVLRMIYNGHAKGGFVNEQVSLVLGENYVISLQEGKEGDVFNPVRDQIRKGKGRIRKSGADYLAYSLMDAVVDGYFEVLEEVGEQIELQEDMVLKSPSAQTVQDMHRLKREMIYLRKSLWPMREVVGRLERDEPSFFAKSTGIYLKDIYDHVVQQIDTLETYRDMLTEMMDIYLSSLSNRINEVMKVLTIIATIFIPLTFFAGVYGMNFQYFPEIHWRLGYLMFWMIILTISGGMLYFFRRKKWI